MIFPELRGSPESDGGRVWGHVAFAGGVMAESPMELFRCPACGKVVSLPADAERVCGECGYAFGKPVAITPRGEGNQVADPGGGMVQRDVATTRSSKEWARPAPTPREGSIAGPEPKSFTAPSRPQPSADQVNLRRPAKKRGVNPTRLLLHLGGWSILLMVIAIGVKFRMGKTDSESTRGGTKHSESDASMEEGMQRFLMQELPSVRTTLLSYLAEASWVGRAQFVSNSSDVAPKMQRHYRSSRMWSLSPGSSLTPTSANVIRVPGGNPIVETVFQVESHREAQGEPYLREVVFVRERNRWKIDWEALVRHAPQSWSLFYADVAGSNQPAEFRLFARKIMTRVQEGTPVMVLKFYQLREDLEEMWKQDTPPVVVARDSDNGRRFLEIFQRDPSRSRPGDPRLWHRDPQNLRRVRVQLRWKTGKDDERYLVVDKVLAGNWLSGVAGERVFQDRFSSIRGDSEKEEKRPNLGAGEAE